jgi:hypothetical protein
MSKEKFELMFLAGGAMLDVISNRLRRRPSTPREEVGAAAHEVSLAFEAQQQELVDPDAVRRQIAAIRGELSSSRPNVLLASGYLAELAIQVRGVPELEAAVARLQQAVTGYLG